MIRRALLAAFGMQPLVGIHPVGWFSDDDPTQSPNPDIKISLARGDVPEFKRTYKKTLDNRARIEIEMKMFLSSLFKSATLIQPDGRRIWFDPDRIADKIIDPLLVPLVQGAVHEIFQIDRAWRDAQPSEYTDKKGTRWQRVA